MNTTENKTTEQATKDFTKTWRYKLGLYMIIIGNLIIVLSALVFPFLGMGAAIIGGLVLAGEGLSLLSIVFLGKEGFKAIKNKLVGAVKASYTKPVSRSRHRFGIFLLLANVLTTYIMIVYAWIAFGATTPETPFPQIFGLDFAQQESMVFWLFLIGEVSFLIAIYILGADWWGKFRQIFIWSKPEE